MDTLSNMRVLAKAVVGLLVVLLLAGLGGYWYLRQSLPEYSGTVTVDGIFGDVDIVRDADAIPHIIASNRQDALFGLGYVHAQDRLWQMEFQRRIGHGRLSEVLGAAALPQDRFLRTVGFGRAARSAWQRLSVEARADINAYVAGVNAFISTHHGRQLPPEFTLLRYEPEPWSGEDVMVWVKMMAWDLSANYSSELFRRDLIAKVGSARAAQLLPGYADDWITTVGQSTGATGERETLAPSAGSVAPPPVSSSASAAVIDAGRPAVPGTRATADFTEWSTLALRALTVGDPEVADRLVNGARTEALGSNNWVVDGTLTASGKPLLANDPHLATHIPSLWYLAHMSAGAFDVSGATLPGTPAVAIGRNRHIAWGETNVAADVQDFYLEKLSADGRSAEYAGQTEPITVVREEIKVSGAPSVMVDVRITRHGPLVSDALNAMNAAAPGAEPRAELPPMAFRWTALDGDDTTIEAFFKLNQASNWDEFRESMRLFVTPSQNFVYADDQGHIGYFVPGRIPVRAQGDGLTPVPGWTGEHEWTGYIPFESLPQLYDPPSHMIVTANARPNAHTDPFLIALEYPDPYRAEQIAALLRAKKGLTPDDMRAIQADVYSRHAATLLPLLLAHVDAGAAGVAGVAGVDEDVRRAVAMLKSWQFRADRDAAAPAIFEAWFLQLASAIAGDELGPRLLDGYKGRYSSITRFVTRTLATNDAMWCDNHNTPAAESCQAVVTQALRDAVQALKPRLGADLAKWQWGAIHQAVFPHQGLDAVRQLRPLLNRSIANGGDWSTVNVGSVDADHWYEQRAIPGFREILDLSPANDSRFQDAVGMSGHFLSPHYDDFIAPWQQVEHKKMRMERADIDAGAVGTVKLRARTQ